MATAELQLYAKVSNKLKSRSSFPLLDSLLALGFPAHTAQKALAATGRKTAQEAADWLHFHYNDPSLEDPIPQEYVLYLCPTGPLLEELQEFWRESKLQCARNRAHEVFPHVTLCEFFTCEDQKVDCLYEALKRAGDKILHSFPSVIPLTLHSSISYLGFFIDEGPADVIREFAMSFATEAAILADCLVKPCTKQLHLTLAHKFYPHHQRTLEQLAKFIHQGQSCQWIAALYSRDMRFVHYQTLRALFQYKPQNVDELLLSAGEYIFVDRTQPNEASEGWVMATSHRTGCRGFAPENYMERANESDTWVKHRTYTFSLALGLEDKNESGPSCSLNGIVQITPLRRSLLVVRHGERVDQIFGKSWLQQCCTSDGNYFRPDLNFPCSLPRRKNGIKEFENDPPLSYCGIFQARLTGEALLEKATKIGCVYSSPALRCIQTAKYILEGLKLEKKMKIRVEPGLFEWTKWEGARAVPPLMTLTELKEAHYNIDPNYSSEYPISCLVPSESYEDYVSRCSVTVQQIMKSCSREAGVVLIVGHGSALDSCTRPLLGLPPRDSSDFAQLVRKIPSLGMCFCEELKEENRWQLTNPPVKTLTHGSNSAFNWRNWILDE